MTIITNRKAGVASIKTRHFSFALKGRHYPERDRPGTLAIPLGFGRRFTIRLRG